MKAKKWEAELRSIAAKHRGKLRPEDVVAFARDPATALHVRFTWDDSKAACAYRLWQARELIAVTVIVMPETGKSYRAFVSMVGDRAMDGGGYRSLVTVLGDRGLRMALLAEALAEFDRWRAKYEALKELAPIFAGRRRVSAGKREPKRISAAG